MIGLVDEYKFEFDNLNWKYQKVLSEIPDPKKQNSEQSSASSLRTNSLERSLRRTIDHIKPNILNIESRKKGCFPHQGRRRREGKQTRKTILSM